MYKLTRHEERAVALKRFNCTSKIGYLTTVLAIAFLAQQLWFDIIAVSYTHLDVYKRQVFTHKHLINKMMREHEQY